MSAGPDPMPALDGLSAGGRRRLLLVSALAGAVFLLEMGAGALSGSQALEADALDFCACALAGALTFWARGRPVGLRASAAVLRDAGLVVLGTWIALTTLYQFARHGVPVPEVMGSVGFAALAANLLSVYLLAPGKNSDLPLRAVRLAARNDTIGNVVVMIAAGLVALFGVGAPDLVVAGAMAVLFLASTGRNLARSWRAWQATRPAASGHGAGHDQQETG